MRIDSHHHFWNYSQQEYPWISSEMGLLQRNFGPPELEAECSSLGVGGVVTVQARQTLEETRWLLDLAASHEVVRGVVGWLPLAKHDIADHLDQLAREPYLKGIRHVVQDEADDEFILGADFNRGVSLLAQHGLAYDILIYAKHLPATLQFVDRHPQQVFILDHIAKPTIEGTRVDQVWAANFRKLAQRENVACKFSGVITEVQGSAWNAEMLRPYWDIAWEAFGEDRLMFGSDWPVCLLKGSYEQWHRTVEGYSQELSERQRAKFWGENAERWYTLNS